ncbi:MAG: hypothetical protein CL450_07340 [Acidimicrobiaceae bacterium]|nr:hypothetical protein [Acidimicrobiaceae bacterium]|tara:strand:- start:350 stop:610 length:261 start_codon:yes stop_codon:yes gene_type:complete
MIGGRKTLSHISDKVSWKHIVKEKGDDIVKKLYNEYMQTNQNSQYFLEFEFHHTTKMCHRLEDCPTLQLENPERWKAGDMPPPPGV